MRLVDVEAGVRGWGVGGGREGQEEEVWLRKQELELSRRQGRQLDTLTATGPDDKNESAVLLSLCSRWSLGLPMSELVKDMLADNVVVLCLKETETETTLRCCSISERTGDTIHYVAVVSMSGLETDTTYLAVVSLSGRGDRRHRLTLLRTGNTMHYVAVVYLSGLGTLCTTLL